MISGALKEMALKGREARHEDYERVRAEQLFEDRASALAKQARVANAIAEGFPEAARETLAKLQTDAAGGFGDEVSKTWSVEGTGSATFRIDQEEVDVTRGIRNEVVNHLRELDPALEIEDIDYLASEQPAKGIPVRQVVGLSVPIDCMEVE